MTCLPGQAVSTPEWSTFCAGSFTRRRTSARASVAWTVRSLEMAVVGVYALVEVTSFKERILLTSS